MLKKCYNFLVHAFVDNHVKIGLRFGFDMSLTVIKYAHNYAGVTFQRQ